MVLDEADRLLDMGFEQTILQILSTIRGVRLPGLKEPANKDSSAVTLDQRWREAAKARAKTCADTQALFHIMVSATLTKAVRALAVPVLGGSQFLYVDADRETVEEVNDVSTLAQGPTLKRKPGVEVKDGVVHFDDEPEDVAEKRPRKATLEEGEGITAPSQLRQYYMLVSCKWRLAALVSFLRSHSHEKLMVFFGTCHSVDFHALLMRQATWPEALDPAIEDDEGRHVGKSQGLDPLPPKFNGMFGDECALYRLHGNVPQKDRQEVYRDFCRATSGILLCTDVAARGLDLPRVDWILQYDPPCETVSKFFILKRSLPA